MVRRLMIVGTVLTTLGVAAVLLQAAVTPSGGVSPSRQDPRIALVITEARRAACREGEATWNVATALRVLGTPATVETATLSARYLPRATPEWRDVRVEGRTPREATQMVRVEVPCDARRADLVAAVHLVGTDGVLRDDATFLAPGVAMSSSAIGAVGIGALASALAFARAVGKRRS